MTSQTFAEARSGMYSVAEKIHLALNLPSKQYSAEEIANASKVTNMLLRPSSSGVESAKIIEVAERYDIGFEYAKSLIQDLGDQPLPEIVVE